MNAIGWTQTLDAMSWPGAIGGAVVALTLAVVLWLFGSRLLRPLCGLTGLAIGAATGWLAHRMMGTESGLWVWMLVGSIVSGTAAMLMFRMWMGLSLCLLLLITAPVMVLAWHNIAPPPLVPLNEELADTQQAAYDNLPDHDSAAGLLPDAVREQVTEKIREQAGALGEKISETVEQTVADATAEARHWSQRQGEAIRTWWDAQDAVVTSMMVTGAAIGAAVGLALGLLMPKTAAAIASGILAAVFGLAGVQSLLLQFKPTWYEAMLNRPRTTMLIMLVVATLGVTWQALALRRTEEE